MIILISGRQGSGKSELTQRLQQHYISKAIKFADPIYEMHKAVWNVLEPYGVKREAKSGDLLQFLGTEFGRKRDPQLWVSIARARADLIVSLGRLAIIDDCRFRNELEAFPHALRIRLNCDREIRKARCDSWRENETHQSEIDLDGFDHKFNLVLDTGELTAQETFDSVRAAINYAGMNIEERRSV